MKKIISILLAIMMFPCIFPAVASENYVLALYKPVPYEDHTPLKIPAGSAAAQRFVAENSWDIFTVACPSFSNNIGSLTLSIYAWQGDYASTTASEKLASKRFVDFADNANLRLFLSVPLPAGEYLFVLDEPEEQVGVWQYFQGTYKGECYLGGEKIRGNFEARVLYVINEGPITVPDEYLTPPDSIH